MWPWTWDGVLLSFAIRARSYLRDLLASVDFPRFLDLLPNSRTLTLFEKETALSGEKFSLALYYCLV